jgi:uncharacterized Ntn-hydrolase superfamily protein
MSLDASTFSIVAVDRETGEIGCAVQSRYFSVGSVVPWVQAGVGAVATQAAGVAVYGRWALEQLESGAGPEAALEHVLADDPGRETRQLGIVTADGASAAFTGAECLDWAGQLTGDGFAVQGNILAGPEVVEEMVRAFQSSTGPLAERLVTSLAGGQAAGGDRRGQQSAAVVVERPGAGGESREGIDRICDLRVEDHAEPIAELSRLVQLWVGWDAQRRAHTHALRGEPGRAADVLAAALAHREEPVLLYNLACYESLAGRADDAVGHVRRAIELDPSYRALAADDADFDPVREAVSAL